MKATEHRSHGDSKRTTKVITMRLLGKINKDQKIKIQEFLFPKGHQQNLLNPTFPFVVHTLPVSTHALSLGQMELGGLEA